MTKNNKIKKTGSKALPKDSTKNKSIKKTEKELMSRRIKMIEKWNQEDNIISIIKSFRQMDEGLKECIISSVNNGPTFQFIHDKQSIQSLKYIYPMRCELIKEYDLKYTSELLLLDSAMINYSRFLVFQHYISLILNNGINSETVFIIDRFNKMSENALNQFKLGLETIRAMKSTPVKVNIKNSQINVGNNQQILKIDDKDNPNDFGS